MTYSRGSGRHRSARHAGRLSVARAHHGDSQSHGICRGAARRPDGLRHETVREAHRPSLEVHEATAALRMSRLPPDRAVWLKPFGSCRVPDYSLVEVNTPDRAIESVEIAGTWVRPPGPPMIVFCFGHPAKVDEWIQAQRGRPPKVKTTVDVWEYYRSCGIAAGSAACATVSQPPVYGCCIRCREMIGPKECVNRDCPEHDGSWLTDHRPDRIHRVCGKHQGAVLSSLSSPGTTHRWHEGPAASWAAAIRAPMAFNSP